MRVGLIIDGTGRRYKSYIETKKWLENAGYDVSMLYVHVNLETAIERNAQRRRKVENEFLTKTYHEVEANLETYKSEFGNNFIFLDNTDFKNYNKVWPEIKRFLSKPNKRSIEYRKTRKIA